MIKANLIKPNILPYKAGANTLKLTSMKVPTKTFGEIDVKSTVLQSKIGGCSTYLSDKNGTPIGFEDFAILPNKDLEGYYIFVKPEFTHKKEKFGELLRLTSIIDFVENKMEAFKIYSKETAVLFHSKYKFEPNIIKFGQRDGILSTIVEDVNCKDETLVKRAKELIKSVENNRLKPEKQREYCKEANKLAKEYIENLKNMGVDGKEHKFESGIDMVLTKENLIKNKDFYNELFQKHGIDYKI